MAALITSRIQVRPHIRVWYSDYCGGYYSKKSL